MLSVILPVALVVTALQDPDPGIARDLALERARLVRAVRYELRFTLRPGMDAVAGRAAVRFDWKGGERPLVLDFGGSRIDVETINGRPPTPGDVRRVHDHVVLAPRTLRAGENVVETRFRSPVAATGTPLSAYRDQENGEEYLYTLVVPADAHRLFPCFDQPDLKARVRLELDLPRSWVGVANGALESATPLDGAAAGARRLRFAETPPLPTYLIAFAAGPFDVVEGEGGLRILHRAAKAEWLEQERVFAMHRQAVGALEALFATPYPFAKLDLVLVPGFPYGGMEHAGAIFYRETALVFDHAPTEAELARRSTLIYHEVAHQWFGNLVTMRWFDDLWLKEGFATLMGYELFDRLEPERAAWLRFHQRVKPGALQVDVTPGTVPVWQELGNLDEAKSNYGPIVYNKAPAVLRELRHRLGEGAFAKGLRAFLRDHAWGNATWDDLVGALAAASGEDLERWSERWILSAGMPRVRAVWSAGAAGRVTSFRIEQGDVQAEDRTWPLAFELLVRQRDGSERRVRARLDGAAAELTELVGTPAPAWVLPNPADVAYGQFLLDPVSRDALLDSLPAESDRLLRAVAFSALFESVREAELEPARFAGLALRMLEEERDALTHAQMLRALGTTLSRYLPEKRSAPLRRRAESMLRRQLRAGELPGMELQVVRALARLGKEPETLALWAAVLEDTGVLPGLEALGTEDRFLLLAARLAAGEPGAADALAAAAQEAGPDVARGAFLAGASVPDARAKEDYFATYLDPGGPPEQWVQESLTWFHWPGQSAQTLPCLRPALDALERVKAERKIFFMPAWIDAFVNGHSSPEALAVVEAFLAARADLPADVRLKLLQSLDGLQRAVRVRRHWAAARD